MEGLKVATNNKRRTSPVVIGLAVILIPATLLAVFNGHRESQQRQEAAAAAEAAMTPEQRAERDAKEAQFQASLERARLAVSMVKASAKNPDSVRIDSVFAANTGAICVQYGATNSFNAMVPAVLILPKSGAPTQGDPQHEAAQWNKLCATAGRELKAAL